MSEYRAVLERARQQFPAPEPPLVVVLRRRGRRQRNRRIAAGVVALGLAALVFGGFLRVLTAERPPPADDTGKVQLPTAAQDWTRVQFLGDEPGSVVEGIVAGGPGLVAVGSDVTSGGVVWTSADGRTWNRIEGSFDTCTFVDVTTGGPGLVAASLGRGCYTTQAGNLAPIWTSTDGITWTRAPSDPDFDGAWLRAIATGGPGFVAVGSRRAGPQAWYSADGTTWELASVPSPPVDVGIDDDHADAWMQDVAISGDVLVAVGEIGTSCGQNCGRYEPVAWTSTDGMTWTEVDLPIPATRVTIGGDGFVAVGNALCDFPECVGGPTVWTSSDGVHWREVSARQDGFVSQAGPQPSPDDGLYLEIHSIASGTDGYVAAGGDAWCRYSRWDCFPAEAALWTSLDGETWTRVPSDPLFRLGHTSRVESAVAAAWGSRFVVAANYGEGVAVYVSEPDGGPPR
jgi:hypothetical protein